MRPATAATECDLGSVGTVEVVWICITGDGSPLKKSSASNGGRMAVGEVRIGPQFSLPRAAILPSQLPPILRSMRKFFGFMQFPLFGGWPVMV